VLGIAGCRRRVANQPSWAFEDTRFVPSAAEHRSGVVGHGGPFPDCRLSYYGAPNQEVQLLDGALLIARSETLQSKGIWFDEAFDFHFYDLDFCRQAERSGLTMATCDLAVVHESTGKLDTPAWREGYARYLAKWGS
jgi:GT2 family glycosyltransferase